jgi:nicotinamidase-related amidase
MGAVPDTDPYPWPYDAVPGETFDPTRLALLVCGAQEHWREGPSTEAALTRVDRIAPAVRAAGGILVWIRHGRDPVAARTHRHLPAVDEHGYAALRAAAPGDLVIEARGYDGFRSGRLDDALRAARRDRLAFAGLAGEVLVDSTLRHANDRGYECLTLADAVAPLDPATGARALDSVTKSGGIFGAVGTTSALLAALGRRAPIEEVPS